MGQTEDHPSTRLPKPTLDPDRLSAWIGRVERSQDVIDPSKARQMQLTLDREADLAEGAALPPLWHYIYFNPEIRARDLGADGHERLGRFLPPVALPRRMWAASTLTIHAPLRIGDRAEKTTTITSVELKTGRSGTLCFVGLRHDITAGGTPRLSEQQTVVYREIPALGAAQPAGLPSPQGGTWSRSVSPDPMMLFRYSALIFYAHRIHYDADWTRGTEGYPDLVVHGPLIATLLADGLVAHAPEGARLREARIRAVAPIFAGADFTLAGHLDPSGPQAWATDRHGHLAMTVDCQFE